MGLSSLFTLTIQLSSLVIKSKISNYNFVGMQYMMILLVRNKFTKRYFRQKLSFLDTSFQRLIRAFSTSFLAAITNFSCNPFRNNPVSITIRLQSFASLIAHLVTAAIRIMATSGFASLLNPWSVAFSIFEFSVALLTGQFIFTWTGIAGSSTVDILLVPIFYSIGACRTGITGSSTVDIILVPIFYFIGACRTGVTRRSSTVNVLFILIFHHVTTCWTCSAIRPSTIDIFFHLVLHHIRT